MTLEDVFDGGCRQCEQTPRPHHPHHGVPGCDTFGYDPDCGCDEYLWCYACGESWPCPTKQEHVAQRAALREGEK